MIFRLEVEVCNNECQEPVICGKTRHLDGFVANRLKKIKIAKKMFSHKIAGALI